MNFSPYTEETFLCLLKGIHLVVHSIYSLLKLLLHSEFFFSEKSSNPGVLSELDTHVVCMIVLSQWRRTLQRRSPNWNPKLTYLSPSTNTAIKPEHWSFSLVKTTHTLTSFVLKQKQHECHGFAIPVLKASLRLSKRIGWGYTCGR